MNRAEDRPGGEFLAGAGSAARKAYYAQQTQRNGKNAWRAVVG